MITDLGGPKFGVRIPGRSETMGRVLVPDPSKKAHVFYFVKIDLLTSWLGGGSYRDGSKVKSTCCS